MESSNPLLSRKFLFALLIAICGYIAMLIGKMTPHDWNSLVVWCYGLFAGANVVQGVGNAVTDMVAKTKTNPPAA